MNRTKAAHDVTSRLGTFKKTVGKGKNKKGRIEEDDDEVSDFSDDDQLENMCRR